MKRLAKPFKYKLFIHHPIIDAIVRLKNRNPRPKTFYRRYLILRRRFYNCAEWKALALEVKKRAGFRCKLCHNGNTILNAHHIQPIYYFPELALCIWNLICLCQKCHKDIHREAQVA